MVSAEVIIIGGGIAGASLAAELAPHARVVLVEAESQPGYHTTGRSAAFWAETYGGEAIQPLTSASGEWLRHPPDGFAGGGYLGDRGALMIADESGRPALDSLIAEFDGSGVRLEPLDRVAIERLLPGVRPGYDHGLAEPSCQDIDVAALHADYLRAARRSGARILLDQRIEAIGRVHGGWHLESWNEEFSAEVVVNAAGAWADVVADKAGARPLGITPFRRTVSQLAVEPAVPSSMPLVIDAGGLFYFKPAAGGRLWLSPHDETPSPPCDAAPEELDIATAIHRMEQAVDWTVHRVEHSWAGLRSFAPDRAPVYGFDAVAPGFFWFAGQGGFGIQTAPAAAMIGAALLLGRTPPSPVAGIDLGRYAPSRFSA
jgi:D-arginine dehydrogenase